MIEFDNDRSYIGYRIGLAPCRDHQVIKQIYQD